MLSALDPRSTPGFTGGKAEAAALTGLDRPVSSTTCRSGSTPSPAPAATRAILLVVQGMDTAGKGGIMRHVVGSVDPQGVRYTAFKAPTAQEKAHPFLWRIRNALPHPGQIGVFDRSHYEDVLIARVHEPGADGRRGAGATARSTPSRRASSARARSSSR